MNQEGRVGIFDVNSRETKKSRAIVSLKEFEKNHLIILIGTPLIFCTIFCLEGISVSRYRIVQYIH
jgi:hypothetical protein